MRGIIINELEVLNNALQKNEIDEKKPFITLRILTKHYLLKGFENEEVVTKIDEFMKDNYTDYRQNKWLDKIKGLVKTVSKYNHFELMNIDTIYITEEEWELIINLNNKQLEKIAFVLLVYQKINIAKNPKSDGWINQTITDIFNEANVKVRGDEQKICLHQLYKLQYIKQKTTCNSTSIKVNFVHEDSNSKILIDNFNNVVSYYDEYKNGVKYIVCEICGKRIKVNGEKDTSKKYCTECSKEKTREKTRLRVQKHRSV